MQTIQEAKQYLRDNWEKGIDCPCCGRLVKRYRYRMPSPSARSLIILYRIDKEKPSEWIHVQKEFASRGMNANGMGYILLHWWGLIESKPGNEDTSKRANGYWRITPKGRAFVEGSIRVPSPIYIYDNRLVSRPEGEDTTIDIYEALGTKFNYQELMHGL